MSGTTLGRPASRFPGGLLGMLLLVAALECGIRARSLDYVATWSDDWRQTAQAASSGLRNRDVLFFGDSLVKYGLLPRHIEARTGLKSYNLALNAGMPPASYFLFRQAIAAGARPKAVVVNFLGDLRMEDPNWRIEAYTGLTAVRDCLDMARTAGDPDFAARSLLGKALKTYQCRFQIRTALVGALNGIRTSAWPAQEVVWKTWAAQDGAQPMPFMPWGFSYDPKLHQSLAAERWECNALNLAYIEKFLALAESKRIPVYWLIPPVSPQVYASRRPVGTDEAFARFARAVAGRHANVEVLDASGAGYDDSVHVDLMHLECRGAKVLSADVGDFLADQIRNHRPPVADRWVTLPAFANRLGDEPTRSLARAEPAVVR